MAGSIVIREEVLDPSFVPPRLLHRDRELQIARKNFSRAFQHGLPYHLLVHGRVGTGKTCFVRRLAEDLAAEGRRLDRPVRPVYINCWRRNADRVVALELLRAFGVSLPDRGFSLAEMMDVLEQGLRREGGRVLIILDEVTSLVRNGTRLVYLLSRGREVGLGNLSLVLVAPQDVLPYLDEASRSGFGPTHQIPLEPYDAEALTDIVLDRATLAFRPGSIDRPVAQQIASVAAPTGDARLALELLTAAAHHAEDRGSREIAPEDVREAHGALYPTFPFQKLEGLSLPSLMALEAVARVLSRGLPEAESAEVRRAYAGVAEEMGIPPRSRVSFWRTLRDLEQEGLIEIRRSGRRGEASRLVLNDLPLAALRPELQERIARRRASGSEPLPS